MAKTIQIKIIREEIYEYPIGEFSPMIAQIDNTGRLVDTEFEGREYQITEFVRKDNDYEPQIEVYMKGTSVIKMTEKEDGFYND